MLFLELLEVLQSTRSVIDFLRGKELLVQSLRCSCGRQMTEQITNRTSDGFHFRCTSCKKTRSIRTNSIFSGANIPLQKAVALIYLTSLEVFQKNICETLGLDKSTLIVWEDKIRNAYSRQLGRTQEMFGGPGVVVEVDESLVAKAKPSRNRSGRPVTERWVFGLFDRSRRLGTMQFVPNRSAETLLPIIQRYCLPGTTIYSDGWLAYNSLRDLGYNHEIVIHEHEFVVPGTYIHTNNVESYWSRCKRKLKRINGAVPHMLPAYLDEFMWKERYGTSVFNRFINTLASLRQ
jgi:transposase-like protein